MTIILNQNDYENAFAEYVETMWELERINEPNTWDIMKENVLLVIGIKYKIPKQWLKNYIVSETEKYKDLKDLLDDELPISINQSYK